jgi:hypothetical protein
MSAVPAAADDIKAFCADKWPSDFRMQKYCGEQQTEGRQQVFSFMQEHGFTENGRYSPDKLLAALRANEPFGVIGGNCLGKWQTDLGFDWRMVRYCMDQQTEAYRALN